MSSIHRGFSVLIGFVCVGCFGAPDERETSEPSDPTVDVDENPGSQLSEPDEVVLQQVPRAEEEESAKPFPGSARLVERNDRRARDSVCIAFDETGAVETMDEHVCQPASLMHECTPDDCPWVECGGCLLYLEQNEHAAWTLTARPGSDTCQVFDGEYAIDVGTACIVDQGP